MHGGLEIPSDETKAAKEAYLRTAIGFTHMADRGFGRSWSPQVEVLLARPFGEHTEWDVVPQLQISLSKIQHVMIAGGVRMPVNARDERRHRRRELSAVGLVRRSVHEASGSDDASRSSPYPYSLVRLRGWSRSLPSRSGSGPAASDGKARPSRTPPKGCSHTPRIASRATTICPRRRARTYRSAPRWRSTIMANAARDPYFQASVRRETIDHSGLAREIQDECAACHVPMAQKTAHAPAGSARSCTTADGPPRDADDRLARDGVSCTVCHQISGEGLGTAARSTATSGCVRHAPTVFVSVIGPFAVDRGRRHDHAIGDGIRAGRGAARPAVRAVCDVPHPHHRGDRPRRSRHRIAARADELPGMAPQRVLRRGRSCQSCHMPRTAGPMRVSSVLGEERDGLSRHAFVGGNAFMLRLLNRFRELLGVDAPDPNSKRRPG